MNDETDKQLNIDIYRQRNRSTEIYRQKNELRMLYFYFFEIGLTRKRDKQRDGEIDKQINREKYRQRDRQTERQIVIDREINQNVYI